MTEAVQHPPFADHQNDVYLKGLGGERPAYPYGAADLERRAYEVMSDEAVGYVAGGAGSEDTMRANREAFDRWRIVPRMLRGVPRRDLSTTVLGRRLPVPVLLAPIGVTEIIHPDAERAVAAAAATVGVPMVLSTASSTPMEDVAALLGDTERWYQLYWPKDRALATSFVQRAEAAGYSALVVTVDTWQLGWRPRDLDRAYLPFLQLKGVANYLSDPVFLGALAAPPDVEPIHAVLHFVANFSDPTLTWDDLEWLRGQTRLPIVLKGIQHPDDVRLAREHGAAAVVCSNHGGRQVDGAAGSLDQLPAVVEAAGDDVDVLFDSGVRAGADAVKALALGARAVLLGRPYLWGLALGGEAGVEQVLRGFLGDLDLQLGLSGHGSVAELSPASLAPRPA